MNQCASFQIWSAKNSQDISEWISFWNAWPQREIHAHPNYMRLYTDEKTSHAYCAFWKLLNAYVLYPFILRDLTVEPFWSPDIGSAADIVTPYGYGGPYVWGDGDRQDLANQFWLDFDTWAAQQNLVCEFIRFTLFEDTVLKYPGEKQEKLLNVVRDLDLDEESLWMDFAHKVRKNVNRSRRNNVYVELDPIGDKFDDFMRLYRHTMDRRNANSAYYFSKTYFEQLHQTLSGQFMYFHAIHNKRVISTELILISADKVYSFLGGTDSSSFDLRPNDLLKYEIMLWAKQHGKHQFVLGGGYEVNDGIYQYKLAFSPNGVAPFCIGYRIFRSDLYHKLIENKGTLANLEGKSWIPQFDYFPVYRS
jgi:hypothetical protein